VITLADFPVPALISAISAVTMAIIALITYIAKALFEYLVKRIETLEKRQDTVLTGVVSAVEDMAQNVKTTADFTVMLVEDLRYRERRRQEDRQEGKDKP
jgi:hypothetical protein